MAFLWETSAGVSTTDNTDSTVRKTQQLKQTLLLFETVHVSFLSKLQRHSSRAEVKPAVMTSLSSLAVNRNIICTCTSTSRNQWNKVCYFKLSPLHFIVPKGGKKPNHTHAHTNTHINNKTRKTSWKLRGSHFTGEETGFSCFYKDVCMNCFTSQS